MERDKLRAFKRFTTWINQHEDDAVENFLKEISEWDNEFCGRSKYPHLFTYTEVNAINTKEGSEYFASNRDWLLYNDVSVYSEKRNRIRMFIDTWMERSIYVKYCKGKYSINLYDEVFNGKFYTKAVFTLEYDYSLYEMFMENLSNKAIMETNKVEEPEQVKEEEINTMKTNNSSKYYSIPVAEFRNIGYEPPEKMITTSYENDELEKINVTKVIPFEDDERDFRLKVREFLITLSSFDKYFINRNLILTDDKALWNEVDSMVFDSNRDWLIEFCQKDSIRDTIVTFINTWMERSAYIKCGGNYHLSIWADSTREILYVEFILVYPIFSYRDKITELYNCK